MHHPKLIDHFQNPRNAGELHDADAVLEVSNPVCGDILKLWVKLDGSRVSAVRFKCRGCVASMACASALTEIVNGTNLGDPPPAPRDIEEAVGELNSASKHAAVLAADAWRTALQNLSKV